MQYNAVLGVDTHLMPLKEAIWDARSKWKDIGRKLGLTDGDINAIKESEHNISECLNEVLVRWIQTGKATIYDLLKALKSEVIDCSGIVSKILSLRGEERKAVGLPKEISGE